MQHDFDVLKDIYSALNTLFIRKEYNPGGRLELPPLMGVPGGKLDEECVGQIVANVYQHWDRKPLHVMLRGSNDIQKSISNRT